MPVDDSSRFTKNKKCPGRLNLPGHFHFTTTGLAEPVVIFLNGSKTSAHGVFTDQARVHELKQIIWATGLGANTGHLESAKGVAFDECAD